MNHHQPPEPPVRTMPLYPKAEAAAKRRRFRIEPVAWVPSAALLGIVIAAVVVVLNDNPARSAAAADASAVPSSQPGIPVPQRKPVEKSPPVAEVIAGDGIWIIGRDIKRGTYKTAGGVQCYWARRSDLSGEQGAILANNFKPGPQKVAMGPDDVAFESAGCGPWELMK